MAKKQGEAADSIVASGDGQAGPGVRAAGFQGKMTAGGEETYLPYERPPFSKGNLCGQTSEADRIRYGKSFYSENSVRSKLGSPVTRIDRKLQTVEDHATAVVVCIIGEPVSHRPTSWFRSDQYDMTLHVVGDSGGGKRSIPFESTDRIFAEAHVGADDNVVKADGFAQLCAIAKDMKNAERLIRSWTKPGAKDVSSQQLSLCKFFARARNEKHAPRKSNGQVG